jgi:hypothetical protein
MDTWQLVAHVLHLGHGEVRHEELHQELEELPELGRRQWKVVGGQRARVALVPAEVDELADLLQLPALVGQCPVVLESV